MLLFIAENTVEKENLKHFNTSHVTVYHKGTQLRKEQTKNFNTSHVTVYRRHTGNDHPVSEFQYISCYCLSIRITIPFYSTKISIHLMLLFIGFALYESGNTMVFQYISCYCLSLYQHSWMCLHQDFNTSHVTVYQGYHKAGKEVWDISIHLMLLFIIINCFLFVQYFHFNTSHVTVYLYVVKGFQGDNLEFQYISCYCLSAPSKYGNDKALSFQYISCYCLSCWWCSFVSCCWISIHLMLLFILQSRVRYSLCY